ncbi:MAG TPA: prepilin-type N-terminal cleavage/methylation domain-containing protein [Gemmatimonadaceae bacterium]|nr:prepilin-type N-terminal cleavage/methylation domain-containing protein [Gemmatimonadaceae bacterium]
MSPGETAVTPAHSSRPRGRAARGVTLLELLVTLALLGLIAGVTGLSLRATPTSTPLTPTAARVAAARDAALRSGHPVTEMLRESTFVHSVTALPDGRVLTDLDAASHATP